MSVRSCAWRRAATAAFTTLACGLLAAGARGQETPSVAPRYHALLLDCSRYLTRSESDIQTSGGRLGSREQGGSAGILVFRARQSDSLVELEAWFDSLSVWRLGNGIRTAPETDGVIGGRFRGTLTPTGLYRSGETPFVPDDLAAVSNVAGALDDLLPPLPDSTLGVGDHWGDDSRRITRLRDGEAGGRRVLRFHIEGTREISDTKMLPDSTSVEARGTEAEDGTMLWDPDRGPVRWERAIRAAMSIPAGGGIPRGFRTTISQQVELERLKGGCEEPETGR